MNKTYIPALLVLIVLLVLHCIGTEYHLYVKIGWYDIMMHVLGGVGIGLSTYWVLKTFVARDFGNYFWLIITITFFLGLAWEIMEAIYNIAGGPVGSRIYYIDTVKDLFNDTLGAVIAYLFIRKK